MCILLSIQHWWNHKEDPLMLVEAMVATVLPQLASVVGIIHPQRLSAEAFLGTIWMRLRLSMCIM